MPKDVIALIQSGKLKDHILLVRGGTTTFLAPALSMGAIGVITMSGAPESHLGILSREFQTPCVMTVHLITSDSRYEVGNTEDKHFREIAEALDGREVRLDCTDGADDTSFMPVLLTGSLIDYDARNSGALLRTLRAFFDADCSLRTAAERLFVHHKTLRYRLERIQQLTGLDLGRHEDPTWASTTTGRSPAADRGQELDG